MATKIIPTPDRFTVRRAGAPDRLAPEIRVPAAPEQPRIPVSPATEPAVPAR